MELHNLPKLKGKKRKAKRVGRGGGSGKGFHTTGRGNKGQKARSKVKLGFEGGQLPLIKRLPYQKGFKNPTKKYPYTINVGDLAKAGIKGPIKPKDFVDWGFIKKVPRDGIKILGGGKLNKKLSFSSGFKFSKGAVEKILKAGGKISEQRVVK